MSTLTEMREILRDLGWPSVAHYVDAMETFVTSDSERRQRILSIIREGMLEAACEREDVFILEFEDLSNAQEEALLIIEEWLEEERYTFELDEERKDGRQRIALVILLARDWT